MSIEGEFDLSREHLVQAVISAAGGRLVGRVRLQKVMYLLDQLGLNSGFSYEYHHYGPYSESLYEAVDFAKAFELIEERFENRASDGARYSVFEVRQSASGRAPAELEKAELKSALGLMNETNATILELAATAHFLKHFEGRNDWRDEIVRRKGVKTDGGRLDRSVNLLKRLGLEV